MKERQHINHNLTAVPTMVCPECKRHGFGEFKGLIESRERESVIGDCSNPLCGAEFVYDIWTREWNLTGTGEDKEYIQVRRSKMIRTDKKANTLVRFAGSVE